jgi:hypothetical protein
MKRQLTWQRRFAHKLLEHGAQLLPSKRASWAVVMRNEICHIEDDREALKWALGSFRACLAERVRALPAHRIFSARAIGSLWIVIFVLSSAYNVIIALTARLGLHRAASALGWWMKDFQYDRFLKFANAIPVGLFGLLGAVVFLFVVSLNLHLRNRPSGFATFCCAMSLSLVAWLYQLGIPAYLQAISTPHRWRIGLCFVVTAAVLSALRLPGPAPKAATGRLSRRQP